MADNIEVIAALRDLISRPAGQATAALHRMEQQLEDLHRDFVAGRISSEQYSAALRRMSRTSRLAGRDSERFRRTLRNYERTLGRNRRRGLRGMVGGLTGAFAGMGKQFAKLSKLIPALKLPAMATAFSVLVPIVTALGGGVFALVGHFGPMVTLLAGLPGLLLAGGAALGVFALALSGISEAVGVLTDPNATLEQINEAFADKTPAFKNFAVQIAALKTPFQQLRDAVQESLLPSLGDAVERMAGTYFPFFERQLTAIAEVLGGLAERFSVMATSASWMKDMETIWADTRHTISEVGGGILHIVSALRGVMVAFAPVMRQMADGFHRMTARFDRFANSAEGRKSMGEMFQRGWDAAKQFWSILKNLAIALWNIANIGRDLGSSMGGGFENMMIRFREWTQSTEGQDRIRQFFRDIKQTLVDLGELFAAIGRGFASMGGGKGDQEGAQSFLDGLTAAVPGVFKVLEGLIRVASAIGWLLEKLGPTGSFLLTLAVIFGRVIGAIMPLLRILGRLGGILWRVGGFLLQRLLIPAITTLAAVLGWPITIALLLVAAFVLLYKKSERFRDLVHTLGDAFMDGLGWVKEKVIDPIIEAVKDLIDWIGRIDFPEMPDMPNMSVGNPFNDDNKKTDEFGFWRKEGGPVWPGQTFNVGEAGRELFVGASGKVDMLGTSGRSTARFSEPGMVIPNPVTEAIMQGATAPSTAGAGHSASSSQDMSMLQALMPPIQVDARGLTQDEARRLIADAIRESRYKGEASYGRRG